MRKRTVFYGGKLSTPKSYPEDNDSSNPRPGLQVPGFEGCAFPRRKSKFLKMLKKYTATRYGSKNDDEPKTPAMENLEKAKEELKNITGK